MGELADKYKSGQHPQLPKSTPSALSRSLSRPPPVPEKDAPVARSTSQATSHSATSSKSGPDLPPKHTRLEFLLSSLMRTRTNAALSDQALSPNKKDQGEATRPEQPKKKQRGHPVLEAEPARPPRVLSPASPNVRPLPRTTPGGKLLIARPGVGTTTGTTSPVKQHSASNLFSNLAEKARSTRTGATGRKQTASASTTASSTGGSGRGRNAAAATGTGTTKGAATTKSARRFSSISESSEGSTSAPVKKGTTKGATGAADKEGAPPSTTKRSVMGTIRKGVTGAGVTKKTATAKTAAQASTATGRVLRKRT